MQIPFDDSLQRSRIASRTNCIVNVNAFCLQCHPDFAADLNETIFSPDQPEQLDWSCLEGVNVAPLQKAVSLSLSLKVGSKLEGFQNFYNGEAMMHVVAVRTLCVLSVVTQLVRLLPWQSSVGIKLSRV